MARVTWLSYRNAALVAICIAGAFSSPVVSAQGRAVCTIGEQRELFGCRAELTTKRHGSSRICTASPPPGFLLLEARLDGKDVNNGDVSVSTIQRDQKFNWQQEVETSYRDLLDGIAQGEYTTKDGKKVGSKLKARIEEDMKSASKEAVQFQSSHQTVLVQVSTANRDRFDKRRSWAKGTAIMKVVCVAPANFVDQLEKKYGLVEAPPPKAKGVPKKSASADPVLAQAVAQAKKPPLGPSCQEVVDAYLKGCLKSCETYKETRKTQCTSACEDPNQLRLRKTQCEEGRKT